jgi:hypothetical protein
MSQTPSPTETTIWQTTVGVVVTASLLVSMLLVAVGGWAWFKGLFETVAPAWIQAVGSVAAIVAATVIAQRQSKAAVDLELRKQAKAETQKLKVVMALMARAHGLSNDICTAFETKKFEDFDQVSPELMIDTHHSLALLPVFEIPDGLLALDVLTIGRALGVMHEQWMKLREDVTAEPSALLDGIARLDTLAREIREICVAAIAECKKLIAERAAEANVGAANG